MWAYLWHRGLFSLACMLALACGLLLAPQSVTSRIRVTARDAVGPGARTLAVLERWTSRQTASVRSLVARWRPAESSVDSAQLSAAIASRDAALTAQRQLEIQVATLQRELTAAREERRQFLRMSSSVPLVKTVAVPARVIGQDRTTAQELADRLIDAGGARGIGAGDLVVLGPSHTTGDPPPELVIDQGTDAELQADLPVASGGVLLGRIRDSGSLTSTVQLLQDPEFRIGAQLVRDTADGPVFGAAGVFAGGADQCHLDLIPATAPVTVGDRVYTQEQQGGESFSLFIGTVTRAELPPGEPHWRIEVAPAPHATIAQVEVLKVELNPQRLATREDDAEPGRPFGGQLQ